MGGGSKVNKEYQSILLEKCLWRGVKIHYPVLLQITIILHLWCEMKARRVQSLKVMVVRFKCILCCKKKNVDIKN